MNDRRQGDPGANAAEFLRRLSAYRRRYRLVTFARLLPAAVAAAVVFDALVVVMWAPGAAVTVELVVASLVGVALTVGGFAAATTRSRASIAAAIDARLALRDHVVSACQFLDEDDPVSEAIVAGAVDRLRATTAAAFPFERPAFLAFTIVAIAAGSALCVGRAGAAPPVRELTGSASVSAQDATNTNRPRGAQRGMSGAAMADRSVASARSPRVRDTAIVPGVAQTSGTARTSGNDGSADARYNATPRAGGEGGQERHDQDGRDAAGRARSAVSASGAARSGSAATGFGNGGGSTPSRPAPAGASGGVSRGAIDPHAADDAMPSDDRRAEITPFAARERAEQAIARGRVPRRFRGLVRSYFSEMTTVKPR